MSRISSIILGSYASLRRWQEMLSARLQLRGCHVGRGVRASGRVVIDGRSNIRIGRYSVLVGGLVPTRLIAHDHATLEIGRGCVFNYGARIEAYESIHIGNGCKFGMDVEISDCQHGRIAPVVIEDRVWLAHGVKVKPGVHIRQGAVVSAGSVVTSDIPAGTLAIGNPARAVPISLVDAQPT